MSSKIWASIWKKNKIFRQKLVKKALNQVTKKDQKSMQNYLNERFFVGKIKYQYTIQNLYVALEISEGKFA